MFNVNRRKPNLNNRVDEQTEQEVADFAIDFPAHGQVKVGNGLRKKGIFVSSSKVRSICISHILESMRLRLRH